MQGRLSVDVVGCGEIAQIMHLPHLFELSDLFAVRAICDRDPHVLKGVAERHGVDAAYTDHREMIRAPGGRARGARSPGDHAPIIRDAIEAGMDVFVEKPLCYSTEDAHAIARTAEAAGRTVMVGYSRLFDTAFQTLSDALRAEEGPVYLRAEAALPMDYHYLAHHDVVRPLGWTPPSRATEWGGSWRYLHEEVLFNLAIHEIYCLRVLTGIARPETVTATDLLDRRGVEASWRNGADAAAGRMIHASVGIMTMDTIAGGYVEEFRAVTSSQTLVLEYPSIYLKNWPAKLSWTGLEGGALIGSSMLGSYVEPFRAELVHFHQVLSGESRCISPAADAADDVETLNRIYAAAKAVRS